MRGLWDTMRTFRDSSRRFCESIRKPIANSSHPSEIGALGTDQTALMQFGYAIFMQIEYGFSNAAASLWLN